jgi:hypothetical protein
MSRVHPAAVTSQMCPGRPFKRLVTFVHPRRILVLAATPAGKRRRWVCAWRSARQRNTSPSWCCLNRCAGLASAAGCALATGVAIVVMTRPAAAEIGAVVDVLDPVAYAASALVIATASLIAVSVPTLRAARIDPIAILRKD